MRFPQRFGGRGTPAWPRVQIGSAGEAQPGTIISAEQQPRWSRERQLFPDHIADVDVSGAFRQRIGVRIVRGFTVSRKDCRVHVDVHGGLHLAQAAATLTFHGAMHAATPEILPTAGCLQLAGYRHWTTQVEIEPVEGRVVRFKLPISSHRTLLKVADVYSQHSRLT